MQWNDNVEPFDFVKEFDPEGPLPIVHRNGLDYLCVMLTDHSMYDRYFKEDLLNVRMQDHCETGQEALVVINDDRVTLRQIRKNEETIDLIPFNRDSFEIESYPLDQVKILGVVQNAIRIN